MSSELNDATVNVQAVVNGAEIDSGVAAGGELIGFAEAALRNDADLPDRRVDVQASLSDAALVDAAAVVGNFQRMVRIADGTGIPLDKPVAALSAGLRDELGLDAFGSAELTPRVGWLGRSITRVMRPIMINRLRK